MGWQGRNRIFHFGFPRLLFSSLEALVKSLVWTIHKFSSDDALKPLDFSAWIFLVPTERSTRLWAAGLCSTYQFVQCNLHFSAVAQSATSIQAGAFASWRSGAIFSLLRRTSRCVRSRGCTFQFTLERSSTALRKSKCPRFFSLFLRNHFFPPPSCCCCCCSRSRCCRPPWRPPIGPLPCWSPPPPLPALAATYVMSVCVH